MLRVNSAWVLSVSLLGLLCRSAPSGACSCTAPSDFNYAVTNSGVIFRGTVLEVNGAAPDYPYEVWVTVHVTKYWKGASGETIRIMTPESEAICGFSFNVGDEYLVYAGNYGLRTYTSLCSRTHMTSSKDPDIAALDAWQATPALHASWGKLKARYR